MINIKKIFIVVTLKALFLISLNITFAQQSSAKKDEQPPEIQRLNEFSRIVSPRIREAEAKGNVLTVLEALRTLAVEYPTSKAVEHGMLMTFLMERTIELGNYADALRFADFDGQKFLDDASAAAELKDFRPVSAPEAIAEAAAARQIVIVNEAHHVPQHRALTVELLKKLKQKGFTHFAAETLFETDAKLNERGYPIKDTGAYINEPLYGDIVRTALKLGYKVVPYDVAFGGEPDARERGQAENLKKRIFEKDSQAKVLIHVGYGHNSEATRKNDTKLMAGYLKEFTGIDPLTVDQTAMSEPVRPNTNAHFIALWLLKSISISRLFFKIRRESFGRTRIRAEMLRFFTREAATQTADRLGSRSAANESNTFCQRMFAKRKRIVWCAPDSPPNQPMPFRLTRSKLAPTQKPL
jgi:hypothetical protein